MKVHMPAIAACFLLLCTVAPSVMAQATDAATSFHVFPQIADGRFSDGTSYRSTLLVANPSSSRATCNFRLHGMRTTFSGRVVMGGLTDTFRFALDGSAWDVAISAAETDFSSGYATLACDRPVTAQVLYSLHMNSVKASEATVFSSPPGKTVQFLADHRENSRLGIAVANDTDRSVTYSIVAKDSAGNVVRTAETTVSARSKTSGFVDELLSGLPSNFVGPVTIATADNSDVYAIGLRFTGPTFTTIPATLKSASGIFTPTGLSPSPAVAAMLQQLPGYISSALSENQDLLPHNPHLAAQIQAKIVMLQSPTLVADINKGQFYSEGSVTSGDGRKISIVTVFPMANMRTEASESVRSLELALPILESFMGTSFPVNAIRIWHGFIIGNSGGGGMLFMEDRSTYESRTGPGALPYESILDHELSHSYIGHESLNQFLELYLYNMVHTNSARVESWISARGYAAELPSNVGIAALLDVYQWIGWDSMVRAYRTIYTLRPPYGQPLGAESKQAFVDQAPASLKAQVADKLAKVTY
jgi:hypothetical protein